MFVFLEFCCPSPLEQKLFSWYFQWYMARMILRSVDQDFTEVKFRSNFSVAIFGVSCESFMLLQSLSIFIWCLWFSTHFKVNQNNIFVLVQNLLWSNGWIFRSNSIKVLSNFIFHDTLSGLANIKAELRCLERFRVPNWLFDSN